MHAQLNKFLKILFAIEFFLILVIIILALIDNKKTNNITAYAVKENLSTDKNFKILTKAVCEEKSEHVFCHDELFVKCNDKEYLISQNNLENFTECSNIKLNLSDIMVNGYTVFEKGWIDPRK